MQRPTDDESKVLAALTPKGRHIDACRALEPEPTSGWRASKVIGRLMKENLIKKVKRGHYERT
jgi:hypothetical protein